ncbi:ADP-ribosylation/crystallin J1 [Lysobacter sp. CA199]|uniref:ADP-ribosylation/crystallin J1 n=1 Tax=Lysobacter sp. CA199 TaxID=3455608 RepID=UPI003F8D1133
MDRGWAPARPAPIGTSEVQTDPDTITLYRPVGPIELALLRDSGFKRWPPRLPDQPIFYPVTNERYAAEIAERWNVKDSGYGAVTRFQVHAGYMARYRIHKVGGAHHTEWWVPAEELEALNDQIVGLIEVIREFRAEP